MIELKQWGREVRSALAQKGSALHVATSRLHDRLGSIPGGGEASCLLSYCIDPSEQQQQQQRQVAPQLALPLAALRAPHNMADALVDRCWESLHAGSWRSVDDAWRECYALGQLLFILAQLEQEESGEEGATTILGAWLRRVDLAIMLGSGDEIRRHLDTLCDHLVPRLVRPVSPNLSSDSPPLHPYKHEPLPINSLTNPFFRVPILTNPFFDVFASNCLRGTDDEGDEILGRPLVIRGAMEHWPAMSKWRGDSGWRYWRTVAGPRLVPVEIGSHYLSHEWGQSLMTLDDFLDQHVLATTNNDEEDEDEAEAGRRRIHPPPIGYLAQHALFEQIPALYRDIVPPDYCAPSSPHTINLWLGPASTVTPLHFDPDHNLLAQVRGRKYVRLYSPRHSASLRPFPSGMHRNASQVDLASESVACRPWECVLEEGDMLYIPPKWWHYVQSLAPSISVSFWWKLLD